MFLRKKVNASGSVSVQVVAKTRSRKQEVIKSIGVGRTASEVEELTRRGLAAMDELRGPFLPGLFDDSSGIRSFIETIGNEQVQVIGPELVYGHLFDQIGYGALEAPLFRHLVICRLFSPGSKLKTIDYLERYLHVHYTPSRIYRFLDELCCRPASGAGKAKAGLKEQVEQISYRHTLGVVGGAVCVCFYDMTTLYFEAAEEDELRRYGFSKDGKNTCPQIFLGLLVASGGNPIGYELFEGNTAESKTLIPMIKGLAGKFDFGKPIVVADSGLLTKRNIDELKREGYQFILGARPKCEVAAVRERILGLKLKDGEMAVIDKGGGCRLIVSMSEKRARKDEHNRKKGLNRLQKNLGSGKLTKQNINNRGYNKYLVMKGNIEISIDMQRFTEDARWDGIKGYLTNTTLSKEDILANYGNLWLIERAFRFNKGDLAARPIYHRLRNRIEGHICICFTAYTIILELERRLTKAKCGLTVCRAQELTKNMYAITCILPNRTTPQRIILKMTEEQKALLDAVRQKDK